MTGEMIAWSLLAGLVWFSWAMALAILDAGHHTHVNRQGSGSPEQSDGYATDLHSSRRSMITA